MELLKVIVNGKEKEVANKVNVLELLKIENVKMPEMVTVEINDEIIDRGDFDSIIVEEKDKIEFIYFMGGGSREF